MKIFIALVTGKLVKLFCKIVRRGGTAKPGKIALKICPELLKTLSRDVSIIVVTGSNGKTTSCRMVEKGLEEAGLDYFANRSGANLIEGIATDFIVNSTIGGKCRKKYAVLETDEAACREVCRQIQPKVIFVTNIFLDQVDRFGGVEHTRDWILSGVKNAPDALLCLNADDHVSASIAKLCSNRVVYYGLSAGALENREGSGTDDAPDCLMCGAELKYSSRSFSHLGMFRCEGCGYERPAADYEVSSVREGGISGTAVICNGEEIKINLPALYNVYNAIGSVAALEGIGVDHSIAVKAMADFSGSYGRMEKLNLGRKGATMILVKNGAGCDQVIDFLTKSSDPFTLAVYLNNNISDGCDISWIEGVAFEKLGGCPVDRIYVSGMRRIEMMARLEKAGLGDRLVSQPDCRELISELNRSELPVVILPTYTGMMETREEIIRQCGGTHFWEQ